MKIQMAINSTFSYIKVGMYKFFKGNRFSIGKFPILSVSSTFVIKRNKSKIKIGEKLHARKNVYISANDGEVLIGDNVFLNMNCSVVAHKKIYIGSGSTFGPNVCIFDHDHAIKEKDKLQGHYTTKEVIIGNNVWVGANCTILKGSIIGDNCIIGAGTVIKGKIPDNTIVFNKQNLEYKNI